MSCLLGLGLNAKCQVYDKFGQTNWVCQYSMKWKFDTLNNIVRDDLIILQIGKDISKNYSYYTFQSDSLRKTSNGKEMWSMLFKKAIKEANGGIPTNGFPYKRSKTFVYKNYPEGKITVTDGLSLQDYIYEDELNAQDWEVLDSTKIIMDNPCQLASCTFRGRQWMAWFTPEIPISDGPWKFGGLPGLIMEVHDIGKQYNFVIIGIEKKEEPIVFSQTYVGSKKFEKTKRLEFLKAKKAYLMNMGGYIEMETGIDLESNSSQKMMRYDLIERDY
ncbi:GLPGLI family protein [Marinifilum sp. RC60d5]|uniref:GLPGLI family protein n=1 Tax=Marinifilum sp. RC60d5 TaxID=3458414 RepID=UPI004035D08E